MRFREFRLSNSHPTIRMHLEWVPPDKSVPVEGERVLVAAGGTPMVSLGYWTGENWYDVNDFRFSGVFAWAHLPAPPETLCERWRHFLMQDTGNEESQNG